MSSVPNVASSNDITEQRSKKRTLCKERHQDLDALEEMVRRKYIPEPNDQISKEPIHEYSNPVSEEKSVTTLSDTNCWYDLLQTLRIGMSIDQVSAFDLLTCTSQNYLLSGSAGCGKSWLLERVIKALVWRHGPDTVHITASTGIAALNIGGKTLHSFAGIGLGDKDVLIHRRSMNEADISRWREAKVLIIDEISMINPDFFDKLDAIGRIVRGNDATFGGIRVLACGDFFQLPPVNPTQRQRDKPKPMTRFAFDAKCWNPSSNTSGDDGFRSIILTSNHRQLEVNIDNNNNTPEKHENKTQSSSTQSRHTFKELLNACRLGELTNDQYNALCGRILNNLHLPPNAVLQDLYESSPSDCENTIDENTKRLSLATYMFSLRKDADSMNRQRLDAISEVTEEKNFKCRYWSDQSTEGKNALAILQRDCMAPDCLDIRVGALVILIKNLNLERGLANGAQGVVLSIHESYMRVVPLEQQSDILDYAEEGKVALTVMFSNGCVAHIGVKKWEIMGNPVSGGCSDDELDITMDTDTDKKKKSIAYKQQLPFVLGWAITIHKSQGMTLDNVVVDISKCFEPGMAYVALSRATSIRGVFIKSPFSIQAFHTDQRVHQFYSSVPSIGEREIEYVNRMDRLMVPLVTRLQTYASIFDHLCELLHGEYDTLRNTIIHLLSNPITSYVCLVKNLDPTEKKLSIPNLRNFVGGMRKSIDYLMSIPWNRKNHESYRLDGEQIGDKDEKCNVKFTQCEFELTLLKILEALNWYYGAVLECTT